MDEDCTKVMDTVELQILGNNTMHNIWWLLVCDVSHKSKKSHHLPPLRDYSSVQEYDWSGNVILATCSNKISCEGGNLHIIVYAQLQHV